MILISDSCFSGTVGRVGTCRISCGVGESWTVRVGANWVFWFGSSWFGFIAICVRMGCSGWGPVSNCGCEDESVDSSRKENRSWTGVEETSLAESYMGSSSSPAKFSLAYLDELFLCDGGEGVEEEGCEEGVE